MAASAQSRFSFLVERYATVDTRTLGAFRIYLGLLLLLNLYDRMGGLNLVSFYSNEGVLPNHYALFLPPAPGYWSLLLGFSSPTETGIAVAAVAIIYVLYLVGWQTRVMQWLVLLCVESVNNRFILIQHGGNVVMNILVVWSLFMPLGERFSIDAVLKSLKARAERTADELNLRTFREDVKRSYVGLAYAAVCFNFAAIYFFNALHKGGPSWADGSAVHWTLWQNRLATSLAALVRMHEPGFFSPMLTWGTLVIEWAIPVLTLSPYAQKWLRPLGFASVWALHLGIASLMTLGPFSYGMMGFGVLLLQPWVFDWLKQKAQRPRRRVRVKLDFGNERHRLFARVVARLDALDLVSFEQAARFEVVKADTGASAFDRAGLQAVALALPLGRAYAWLFSRPPLETFYDMLRGFSDARPPAPAPLVVSRLSRWWEFIAPALVLCAVVSQLLMENWGVPRALKPATRPEWMTAIVEYLTIPQGWSMFAPEPPREDSRLVVDAVLADGSHIDVLTGQPPDFEPSLHGPWGFDQHWCELHARMPNWRHHWRNFRDYLMRRPKLLGWPPERQVVSLEVYSVSAAAPPRGSTTPTFLKRTRLFGSDDPL